MTVAVEQAMSVILPEQETKRIRNVLMKTQEDVGTKTIATSTTPKKLARISARWVLVLFLKTVNFDILRDFVGAGKRMVHVNMARNVDIGTQ